MSNLLALAGAAVISIIASTSAVGAPVATFAFTSNTSATTTASNIASASFTSNGSDAYIGDDGFGNVLEFYPTVDSTSAAAAVSLGSYYSIALTAKVGQNLNIGSISYDVGKGGAADPRGYLIRSSLDGFVSDLFSEQLAPGAQTPPALRTVNLSGSFAAATNVIFRFYGYTPNETSGTTYSVDYRNVSFDASTATVPEPATWAMMLGGFGLVGFAMRRRRTSAHFA